MTTALGHHVERTHLLTLVVLCGALILEKGEVELLPSVFYDICIEFPESGPALLGTIFLFSGVASACGSLASAPLGDRVDRIWIVAACVLVWAAANLTIAAAPSIRVLLLARAVTGLCTGISYPVAFLSLIHI